MVANHGKFSTINNKSSTKSTISNILRAQHQILYIFHQLAVEVLVQMRDPARNPCKVGKMEEAEGMLMMWPLLSCLMLHKTRY
jgi:hypothetical protein